MRLDDTLHFDHTTAHPNEFYAPAHFATNEWPDWAFSVILGAVVALVLAAVAWKALTSKTLAKVFAAAAVTAGVVGGAAIVFRGESVHPLPTKSRAFLETATPGDDLELFSTRERALASAVYTGKSWDLPDSSARVITYRLGEWPDAYDDDAAGHPRLSDVDAGWRDGAYTGWTEADDVVIDDYVHRAYGVERIGTSRVEALETGKSKEFTLDGAQRVRLPSGEARCMLTFRQMTTNFLGGPVSATPERLVCTTAPPQPPNGEVPSMPPVFYPPKVK